MPGQAFLQVHETIGHPLELDRILGYELSYAGGSFVTLESFGRLQYGSAKLSVSAFGGISNSPGTFGYDDEGTPTANTVLIEDGIPAYIIARADESETGADVVITESDIDNLIKSKGAVFAAIKSLMDYIGLGFEVIDTLYVAGGFGSFLNIPKAVAIGLLPDIPLEKIKFIGNSSLTGARACLFSEEAFENCLNISRSMTNIELSTHQPFTDEYIAALFLPHTNGKLFPSVSY